MSAGQANSPDGGAPEHQGFHAEVNSGLEPILVEKLFTPLLRCVPESMAPNTISLLGTLAAWASFGLAYLSTRLPPLWQGLALLGAGLGMFVEMTADCLDGMQARRTGRTSKLGEFLDHWLDAIHVPMAPAGIALALGFESWQVVLVILPAAAIYNAQLVLYHHSGRFVHPGTSGVDGQFYVFLLYLALALFLPIFAGNAWLNLVLAVGGGLIQARVNIFYYVRLGRHMAAHLPFVLLCLAYGALYLRGAMSAAAFSLLAIVLSWRITGTWVMRTLTRRPYSGWDFSTLLWLGLLAGAHLVPALDRALGPVVPYLSWVVSGVLAFHNLADTARHFRELTPKGKS